jgi:hypothetical protein
MGVGKSFGIPAIILPIKQAKNDLFVCNSVSQICRYAGCVRADLLFFSFGVKDQHAWHFSTCGHVRISAKTRMS